MGQDFDLLTTDREVRGRTPSANLTGTALLFKVILPHLIEGGGGAIINTSSGASTSGQTDKLPTASPRPE